MTMPSQQSSSRLKTPDLEKVRVYLVNSLTRELENNPPPMHRRREFIVQKLEQVYEQTQLRLADTLRQQIFRDVLDDLLGYGPIQPLLDDPDITEVMVNGPHQVYTERKGKLTLTNVKFEDDDHVLRIIERIILPLGRRIDADTPTVDARLPDG